METIPAIDLRAGRCVRLRQGDYADETVFSDDPTAVAQRWIAAGASRIHVADLDGAKQGTPGNFDLVTAIAALGTPVQVGGGIRDAATVSRYRAAGLDRIVLGTVAVHDAALVTALCRDHPGVIAVSLDARDGRVATDGWTQATEISALDLAAQLVAAGVGRFIYTDIARDGMLTEPNYEAVQTLVRAVPVPVIAAGGVADVRQLPRLAQTGVEAVIIGRALYDGRVDLAAAIAAVRTP